MKRIRCCTFRPSTNIEKLSFHQLPHIVLTICQLVRIEDGYTSRAKQLNLDQFRSGRKAALSPSHINCMSGTCHAAYMRFHHRNVVHRNLNTHLFHPVLMTCKMIHPLKKSFSPTDFVRHPKFPRITISSKTPLWFPVEV